MTLLNGGTDVRPRFIDERSTFRRAVAGWRRNWLQIVIAGICLTYAPLSATYFLHGVHGPRLQDQFLSAFVSDGFAYGSGSGYPHYIAQFSRTFAEMLVHTLAGPLALICGLLQLWPRLRNRFPAVHRTVGVVFVLSSVTVCISAAIFLLKVPGEDLFGGPSFYNMLWGLAMSTFIATALGAVYLVRGQPDRHGAMMLLAFLCLMSAPLLRYEWVAVSWVTGDDKLRSNAIASILNAQLPLIPFYLLRARQGLTASPLVLRQGTAARRVGLAGVLVIAFWAASTLHADNAWMLLVAAALWVVMYVWFTAMIGRAGQSSVWGVYRMGLQALPAAAALMLVFSTLVQGFNPADAVLAGLGTGWLIGSAAAVCVEVQTSRRASARVHSPV